MKFVALALLLVVSPALAHDAPSGWTYPQYCCGPDDCRQVDDADVVETPNAYIVGPSIIARNMATPSPDGHFHICVPSDGRVRCFFAPLRSS